MIINKKLKKYLSRALLSIRPGFFFLFSAFLLVAAALFMLSDFPFMNAFLLQDSSLEEEEKPFSFSWIKRREGTKEAINSYSLKDKKRTAKGSKAPRECFAFVRRIKEEASSELYLIDRKLAILPSQQSSCEDLPIVQGSFSIRSTKFDDFILYSTVQTLSRLERYYPLLYQRISELHINKDLSVSLFLSQPKLEVFLLWNWDIKEMRKLYSSVAYLEKEAYEGGSLDLRPIDAIYWKN